jgi:putative transposase
MLRYRERKNTRMKKWDYSSAGWYFVTICVKNRACVFGDVCDQKMILNNWGKLAEQCWREIPIHFPNIKIDQFIVMPNHVHGMVVIEDFMDMAGNKYIYFPQKDPTQKNRNMMQLSKVIATFKAAVTRKINKIQSNNYFAWQSSFHDHIIRNEKELERIQNYIYFNAYKWGKKK